MKLVVLDEYGLSRQEVSWDEIGKLGELTSYTHTPPELVVQRIGDAQIVFTNKTVLSKEVLRQCANLTYIGVLATGYNVVDGKAAEEQGIVVTNVPSYGTSTVAQYTFALLLELCHHVGEHAASVKAGEWCQRKQWCYWNYPLIELFDKTIGIVGYGKIGKRVAAIANAMGMKVLAFDRFAVPQPDQPYVTLLPLEELLQKSDVVTLHCPLSPQNEHMINHESIATMKTGAMLLNTARGGLVDEAALAEALLCKKLAGAAVDVVSTEPILPDNPLLAAPNCILTPHLAWACTEARSRLMEIVTQNVKSFVAGTVLNQVNKGCL